MKGNNIMKNITKVLLSVCMVFAFLCTPVTNLFSKITKVFASNNPTLTDVEGANVKVEGFVDNGKVGERVRLPKVVVGADEFTPEGADAEVKNTKVLYNVKTPAGKTTLNTADILYDDSDADDKYYYFVPSVEGVYTLDVKTLSADGSKLTTVVSGLNINVTKAEAEFTVMTNAVVKDGDDAYILPEKITYTDLAHQDFRLSAPETDGEITNIVVVCSPAGSTSDADDYTMLWDANRECFYFSAESRSKITENKKVGKYTFKYSYVANRGTSNEVTLQEFTTSCEVVADDSFEDDITLAFGSLKGGSELTTSEIGTWVTLPTVTVYNSKSGSTDSIPAVVKIKVTPSSSIQGAKVEQDGYKFKANKIGKYQITYTATYPYTNLTVTKNFTIELKDTTAPEVLFVGDYDRTNYFTTNTDKTEENFLDSLTDTSDEIKSVVVMQNETDGANITIPAIYAKDNSMDGNYTMSREVVLNGVTTNIEDKYDVTANETATHNVKAEGVYTINYRVTDSSNKSTVAKRIVVVISEDRLKGFSTEASLNGEDIKPSITTGTAPRMVENNSTLTFAMPTATDNITSDIKAWQTKLNNNSYSSWFSNVDVTTTIVGYKMVGNDEVAVTGSTYTFTEDDINDDGKYEIDLSEARFNDLKNDEVEFFRLQYSARTNWMGADTTAVTSATATSTKINYINVDEDKEAATIALATNGTDDTLMELLVAANNKNGEIDKLITAYNTKNKTNFTLANLKDGTSGVIYDDTNDRVIAPFNQYSTENQIKVTLPDLVITDKKDATNLSVTGTITDSLGNAKTFVPEITNIDFVSNLHTYYVSLGSHELPTAGQYTVSIKAVDKGGNISSYSFALMVNDTTGPSDVVLDVDIIGDSTISSTYYTGEKIYFPEAKVEDNTDKECTYVAKLTDYPAGANITWNAYNQGFTTLTAGTYEITYFCEDSSGNKFEKVYTLEVKSKDYTEIVVNEEVFKDNGGRVYGNGYAYTFDTDKNTQKIVIPFGSTRNTVDASKSNQDIKPTVKKGDVTQTVSIDGDNYSFSAIQGTYTVEYKYGTVTKTITLYVGDTEAPTLKWNEDVPTSVKLNDSWGKGIDTMFTITDVNNGEVKNIEADKIEIINPDKNTTILDGNNDVKFSKEGEYTLKITYSDGVNDKVETKIIKVTSEEGEVTNNTTNVVGTILLIASILVVGGVILYLILSSKKGGKRK